MDPSLSQALHLLNGDVGIKEFSRVASLIVGLKKGDPILKSLMNSLFDATEDFLRSESVSRHS